MAEYDIDKAHITAPQHHIHQPSEPLPKPPPGTYPVDAMPAETTQLTDGHTGTVTRDSTTISDKIVGKAMETAGKITRKPELEEKGAIRQERGKEFTIQETHV